METVPTLTTTRFTMRPLQPGDEHVLFKSYSDPDLMRYWSRGPFDNVNDLRSWLFDRGWGGRTWVAVPHAGGDPVLRVIASEAGREISEIGYMIVPGHERQGIARECLTALITHLFRVDGVHRIFGDVDPRNIPSNRLLEGLGFTREAHLRDAMKTHLGWCDTWLWGLLEDEWSL
ncbi:GNAT family protein [Alteraurantiacibacter aestuarii]|uniref:GNAT family N-acetyltransferase n=1 Tax=Alteraurantiacibacter aestuarii TaxID=650004 RepID=A0A844ZJU2_9SPHN|nr:GNAT family protein [Alteraurantiacibacter aestuarii]MXO87834.1 GNAT family N-acetyltransferase [Alteraurantiacibacter aestuarii]